MGFGIGSIGKAVGGLLGGGGGAEEVMGAVFQQFAMQTFQRTQQTLQQNLKQDQKRLAESKEE